VFLEMAFDAMGEYRGCQTRSCSASIGRVPAWVVDFPSPISALQKYVDKHLAPEDRDLHRSEFSGAYSG